jgi:hypothetical protein
MWGMRWLDAFMLDRLYQLICDALYQWVGDCMVIARSVIRLSIGLTICSVVWRFAYNVTDMLMMFFLISQLLLILGLYYFHWLMRHMLGRTGLNPLRFVLAPMRISLLLLYGTIWIVTAFVFTADVVGNCLWLMRDGSVISGMYFASCQNRLPLKRYFRKLVPA